ncbi:hypothetical protein ElyMa_004715000 [Elysia marginata]|uniref:FHA domain-containing protein n=1 Tax=Elysia marginata TaxID=1093978 RepID=A0AAV4I9C4_9GAST|nr:hypothetical protein ElyMa_004715000 [Elysia marginata]
MVIIRKRRRFLQDVRVIRAAKIGNDHNLVIAKLTLKLRKNTNEESRKQRSDVLKLKHSGIDIKFSIALRNGFNILRKEEVTTVERRQNGVDLEHGEQLKIGNGQSLDAQLYGNSQCL